MFLLALALLVAAGKLPLAVPMFYCLASVLTFVVYAFDKSAALHDRRRTPENTLHLLALAGGWPGALLAQAILRHKSRKARFQWVFWLTVLLNLAALGWLLTPGAAALLANGLR